MLTRKILFGLAIALLATNSLVAQDDDKKAKKVLDRATKSLTNNMMKQFAKAELTDEQKTQATAIVEKHTASYLEAKKAQEAVLTEDQLAKKKAVLDQAKADGVKGKEVFKKAFDAMGLTEEETAAYDEGKKKVSSLMGAMRKEISGLLTDEQKAALPKAKGKKGKGKGKKKEMEKTSAAAQAVSLKLPNMT